MKRSLLITTCLTCFFLVTGCGHYTIQSQWLNDHIVIDGDKFDWDGIIQYTLEDEPLITGLANDETHLYLFFLGNDKTLGQQLQLRGVTLWLNTNGKTKKKSGYYFRGDLPFHGQGMPGMMPHGRQEAADRQMPDQPDRMAMNAPGHPAGFFTVDGDGNMEHVETGADAPSAATSGTSDVFCYEFKIPVLQHLNSGEIMLGLELGGGKEENAGHHGPPNRDMAGGPVGSGRRPGGPSDNRHGVTPFGGQKIDTMEIWMRVLFAENGQMED